MSEQGPRLKHVFTSYEASEPLGRVVLLLEHHGVEVTITIPAAHGNGAPSGHKQAEQFLRDAADAVQLGAARFAEIAKGG